ANTLPSRLPTPSPVAVYGWPHRLPFAWVIVPFLASAMAVAGPPFDLVLDGLGVMVMATGLALRIWTTSHRDRQRLVPAQPPTRLVTSGPYALMRHPLPLANMLTGTGAALIAESGLALLVVPTALIALFRVTAPLEDEIGRAHV